MITAHAVGESSLQAATNEPGGNVHRDNVASGVEVVTDADGSFALLRNGERYTVKGAGGHQHLRLLAESGGNSIRTWGIEQLEQIVDGKALLDRAHELGISVTAGFWVQHERHGFDYSNVEAVAEQRASLRAAVVKYKDHPALLSWGLGNEMDGFEPGKSNVAVWKELNHLAGIIKTLDPHHPVMTVIAGASQSRIDNIKMHYPNIDILGVNAYGAAPGTGQALLSMGWDGPYLLTEFGVQGTWEVPLTEWDAPIEPDPGAKAESFYSTYVVDRDKNAGRSLGSYAFYWGQKQETTATWFGMFLASGEKLPTVDAMAYAWTGQWPENRAPKIRSLASSVALKRVKPGKKFEAQVDCVDREGDALRYVWDVRSESSDRKIGGDAEQAPPSIPNLIRAGQGTAQISFSAPKRPGAYRLFVSVFDGQGGAVSHNLPFFVEL